MAEANALLLDGSSIRLGGQVTRIRAFLRRFRDYDPDSRVVVTEEDFAVSRMFADRPDLEFVNRLGAGAARAARRMMWQNIGLPGLCRERRATVYLHFSHYLPYGLPAGTRTIVGVANLQPFSVEGRAAEVCLDKRFRLAVLERTILSSVRRADSVIALSEECKSVLVARGIDDRKVSVIPNGVEQPGAIEEVDIDAVLQRCGIVREFVLYVSHFYRYKNFERLVRAYGAMPDQCRNRYSLVLVGVPHHKECWDAVSTIVAALGLGEKVIMIPGLDTQSLNALYRRCTLFAFPSLVENCPNILLEAMANGAPVIAGDIAPMPEFGGNAAEYFDPLDERSMTGTLMRVLGDRPLLQKMSDLGRNRALAYTWGAFTRAVVDLYR